MTNIDPILQMKNVSKSFPGVKALEDVRLEAYSGEVLALLGENGAGKSTLMKILSGVYNMDAGSIIMQGQNVAIKNIRDAENLGIAIIHQELSLLSNLSIWENIFLGNEVFNGLTRKINKKVLRKKSEILLKDIGFNIDVDILVKNLNVGEKQLIEIAKALSKNSKVIIMDEPTTALTDVETDNLFRVINKLKNENMGIIYISHRMDEIFRICDRITVLRDGKYIGEVKTSDITKDDLISMMVGRKLEEQFPYRDSPKGKTLLRVENLNFGEKVRNVNFEAKGGEILGISGLMGSGRTEMAKTIFGEYKKSSGKIFIDDEEVNVHSPKDSINNGVCYLSEDRKQEGLILGMSVGNNMTLANLKKYENGVKRINKVEEDKTIQEYIKKLSIKTPSADQLIKYLSGGNQQKVILAKWLMLTPKVLIIDEPTRGIDVGAKKEIYDVLNELKSMGKSIIMISSDMAEIMGICDRILIMHEGSISGELNRKDASQEAIMKYAVGIND
ncbi:sugar ABC transporter ATP-binding protein [Clostridium lacusfryxellense]|uniref:sugar ABC transporter ATP-binding protein n=1 Tax=Clostridium lacusfryxellense TaxID=205328 RepID=UPI001C0CBFF4|nr:sugar ABC transporter ATP-binding protein [Clostridium lacusfryxellense]MBU3114402.1 sugar ABC transporter ATP-binding protein [Clostridium lacusfryxellense]